MHLSLEFDSSVGPTYYLLFLHNQGEGVQKDYIITGGRGDLKDPKKGLHNEFIAP